jgi:hypothetical protein
VGGLNFGTCWVKLFYGTKGATFFAADWIANLFTGSVKFGIYTLANVVLLGLTLKFGEGTLFTEVLNMVTWSGWLFFYNASCSLMIYVLVLPI